jgi:hypothetical protein
MTRDKLSEYAAKRTFGPKSSFEEMLVDAAG